MITLKDEMMIAIFKAINVAVKKAREEERGLAEHDFVQAMLSAPNVTADQMAVLTREYDRVKNSSQPTKG